MQLKEKLKQLESLVFSPELVLTVFIIGGILVMWLVMNI